MSIHFLKKFNEKSKRHQIKKITKPNDLHITRKEMGIVFKQDPKQKTKRRKARKYV